MLTVFLLIAVAVGAYWVGVHSATDRRRDNGSGCDAAGPGAARLPKAPGRQDWLLAIAVSLGVILVVGLLAGGPGPLDLIGGPGLFGGPGGLFGP